jgi:hypothetical protein
VRYWDLEEAIKELKSRQKMGIARELEKTYNFSWLPDGKLYGFLARHIASSRLEEFQFFKRCMRSGLHPLWLEYLDDKFCDKNPSKTRLIKLRVFFGRGRRGGIKQKVIKIVDYIPSFSMRKIMTCWGEPLWSFHHRALHGMLGSVDIIDISEWLKSWGRAYKYYEPYLALSIAHGILFESFESPGFSDLEKFKQDVVLPAYWKLVRQWGLEPIIVYHPWPREKEDIYLNYYPPEILKFIPKKK